jgi:hypothetical protein
VVVEQLGELAAGDRRVGGRRALVELVDSQASLGSGVALAL